MTASDLDDIPDENFQRRSAADFFHDNKAIAGFDNSLRVVFTSVRELVENGLDAAEKIQRLPELEVKIELLSSQEIASLLEVDKYSKKESTHQDFLRLSVKDNGSGVPNKDIPDLFGRVLTGSNYGARQTRGRFGLGAKMVLLNAMATVDLPIIVKSLHMKEKDTSEYHLFIDLQKNEPKIEFSTIYSKGDEKAFKESGTEVSVTFTGSWNLAKRYVKEYFHQLSIITPYASFIISLPDGDDFNLPRVVDQMPPYPSTMKIHPWGCDITQLKREISWTKAKTMSQFLSDHFEGITTKKAKEFLEFVKLDDKDPKKLTGPDIRRIVHDGFLVEIDKKKKKKSGEKSQGFNFTRPSGKGLSPLGEDRLKRGLAKELDPFLVEAVARPVNAYSGHAFIIEAALAYGGKQLEEERDDVTGKSSVRIYRFANRIPLLFGAGNDVITKVINDPSMVSWKDYKINLNSSPIAIAVSLVSSKIPFPETSKEYLSDVEEIREEVAQALKALGTKIRTHLSRRERADRERQRKSRFERFAPIVSDAMIEILQENDEQPYELDKLGILLTRALVEGIPKSAQHRKPPSHSIRKIKYWIDFPDNRREKLLEMNVITLADFLSTPDDKLVMKSLPIDRVREIKRVTIEELDEEINTPRTTELSLITPEIESGFSGYEKLDKSLSRRWITTVYDFFVTPEKDFMKVRGFNEKLWALYKREILGQIKATQEINKLEYALNTIPWISADIEEEFTKNSINTVPDFLLAFSNSYLNNKKYHNFLNYVLSFIRKDVKEKIDSLDDNLNANLVTWLSGSSKKALNVSKLKTWQDLVDTIDSTPKTVLANEELIVSVIDNIKSSIVEENNKNDSKLLVTNIESISNEHAGILKKQKINSFYDFLLSIYFPSDSFFIDYFKEFRTTKLLDFNRGVVPLVSELVWIPTEIEDALNKNGIYSIYDFLITPTHRLHEFSNKLVDITIIKEIKQQYGIPLNYLSNDLRTALNKEGIITTEELMNLDESDLAVFNAKTISEIEKVQEILMRPLICIPNFPFTKLHALYHMGIMTLYDFLIWPETELMKAQIPEYDIFTLKNKLDLDEIEKLYAKHTKDLKSLGFLDKKLVTQIEKIGLTKVEDVLFKNHFILEDIYITNDISQNERAPYTNAILQLRRSILSPIIFLPDFKFTKIREVLNKNVRTIMDFMYWPKDELQDLFEDNVDIEAMRENISALKKGIPLESTKFFSGPEVTALKSENINYLEEVYFTLNRQTFAVPRVDWSRIRDTKSMLNLPVGLIVFEEKVVTGKTEDGQEITSSLDKPISHALVTKLNKANINSILEFLIVPPDQLAVALEVAKKEATDIQARLKVKSEEEKMELDENVLGFPKSVIKELDSLDIGTIEGLYFASDDILDENPSVKRTVYSIRRALQSSLRLLPEFTPEMRKKLSKSNINTIATFIMFPSNELANILDIAEERVEETYKIAINVYNLSQLLDNSLSIIPEISSANLLKLRQHGITTIGHLLSLSPEKLAETIDDKAVNTTYHSLDPKDIEQFATVAIQDLENYFTKSVTRKIVRAGFASIQEIVYFAQKEDFAGDEDIWSEIETLGSVLKLPAEHFVSKKYQPVMKEFIAQKLVSVIDILSLTPETVPKAIKISNEDLQNIIQELDVGKLIKITKVPLQVVPGLSVDDRKKLLLENITSVGKILIEPHERIESITGWTKDQSQEFSKHFDIPKLIKSLEISASSVLELESSQSLKLSRKRLTKLLDVISLRSDDLAEILTISQPEAEKILKSVNWDEYADIMNTSITLIYDVPATWKSVLLEHDIKTLSRFMVEDESELSSYLGSSERTISNTKSSISIHSIKQNWKKHQKWFNIAKTYVEAKKDSKLSENLTINGVSIEAKELIKLVELPIANFPLLDSKYLKKLKDNKIITILDIITSNIDDIARLLRIDDANSEIYDKISLNTMMGDFTEPVKLDDIPLMTKQIVEKLQEYKLTTVEKIFTYFEQTDEIPEDLQDIYPKLYRTLQQPILLMPDLDHEQKKNLLANGYKNLTDLIRANEDDVSRVLGYSSAELQKYFKKLNMQRLEQERITIGNLINSLNGFPENVVASLNSQVKFKDLTFEELFLMNSRLNLNKNDQSQVDRMKEAYFAPIVYNYLLMEEYPDLLEKFVKKGFKYIYEFLLFSGSRLATTLEVTDDISRKLRYNLDFDKVKKYIRKEGLPLKDPLPILNMSYEDLDKAKSLGLTTWQELAFPQLFLIPEDEREWVKKAETKVNDLFNLPASRLNGIKLSSVPNLKNKGINSVGEFMFGSSKIVKAAAKLDNEDYNKIREQPALSSQKSLESSLDAMLEKAASTPTTTSKPASTATKISSKKMVSKQTSSKTELQKLRESLAKAKTQDDFKPPVKSVKQVTPKKISPIKSKGVNLSSKKVSSKKPKK